MFSRSEGKQKTIVRWYVTCGKNRLLHSESGLVWLPNLTFAHSSLWSLRNVSLHCLSGLKLVVYSLRTEKRLHIKVSLPSDETWESNPVWIQTMSALTYLKFPLGQIFDPFELLSRLVQNYSHRELRFVSIQWISKFCDEAFLLLSRFRPAKISQ